MPLLPARWLLMTPVLAIMPLSRLCRSLLLYIQEFAPEQNSTLHLSIACLVGMTGSSQGHLSHK